VGKGEGLRPRLRSCVPRGLKGTARHRRGIAPRPLIVMVMALFWWAVPTLHAQSGGGYNIKKSTIDGGGVTFHTGGAYRLGGTVGQHDAGNLSGGGYKLTGGFWSPVAAPGNIVWDANDLRKCARITSQF